VQRFDLVQEKLFEKEPIKPILDRVTQTLQSGHRLWIVGGLPSLKQGEIPAPLPPPPDGPLQEPPHLEAWAKQVSYLVQSHATKGNLVPVELNQPVNLYENYAVFVVEGWR
jgi:hypothetical protein